MAKLINIVETPEAITAEAVSLVWEAYEAPRKRLPRARIVEHRFTVSIPKVSEDVAPLAFVVEHFPQMTLDYKEYRAGYDQPIRWYMGEFYTPARFIDHPYYSGTYTTAREELRRAITEPGVPEYVLKDYAAAIARDEVKANKWYSYSCETAESVEQDAARFVSGLLVIGGELYDKCTEPVYKYNPTDRYWRGDRRIAYPAHISATFYKPTPSGFFPNVEYGALDYIALAYYHADTARNAYIKVLRPDLVTIDSTAQDLEESADAADKAVTEARDNLESLEKKLAAARASLEEAEAKAERSRATLEAYKADPLAYWEDRAGGAADSVFYRQRRGAERIRRELAKEA